MVSVLMSHGSVCSGVCAALLLSTVYFTENVMSDLTLVMLADLLNLIAE